MTRQELRGNVGGGPKPASVSVPLGIRHSPPAQQVKPGCCLVNFQSVCLQCLQCSAERAGNPLPGADKIRTKSEANERGRCVRVVRKSPASHHVNNHPRFEYRKEFRLFYGLMSMTMMGMGKLGKTSLLGVEPAHTATMPSSWEGDWQ